MPEPRLVFSIKAEDQTPELLVKLFPAGFKYLTRVSPVIVNCCELLL